MLEKITTKEEFFNLLSLISAFKDVVIGEDTFVPHMMRLLRMKEIKGRIVFGPVLHGPNTCLRAKEWIDQEQSAYIQQTPQHEPA